MARKRNISVIGTGGTISDDTARLAEEVGELLIGAGFRVVTGGLDGVMDAAARGAARVASPGDVVAIVPGNDPRTAHPHASVVIPTGLGFFRNGLVAHSDAVIAIGGGAGTLSEMALAWKLDRLVVALDDPGLTGWSTRLAGERIDSRRRPVDLEEDVVHKATSPQSAVRLVTNLLPAHAGLESSGLSSAGDGS